MAFISQLKASKSSSRRGSSASIVISQSYKASTDSQELSVRISSEVMEKLGVVIGSKVDLLHDEENDIWLVRPCSADGFKISGKVGGATGLIRYTLKKGHSRFTDDKNKLPIKKDCEEESIKYEEGGVIFRLVNMN